MLWHAEEKQHQGDNGTSNWQVDPETPSPSNPARKSTADQRADNGRAHEDAHPEADQHGKFLGLCHVADHENGAAETAGTSPALKGSGDDQGRAIRCCCGHNTPNQEQCDRGKIDELGRKVFVQLAPHGRRRADEEETGASIPSGVIELVEFVRDTRDCRSDDALRTEPVRK